MSQRVALVTWSGLPGLSDDDQVLLRQLLRQGIPSAPAVWDDPAVDWGSFDAVIVRSTWDYHRRPVEFLEWAARCSRVTRLWNPLSTLRWNSHKRYLLDLERNGISIVPTELGRLGEPLSQLRERMGWSTVVVKPAISANAEGSHLVGSRDSAAFEARYQALLLGGEQLIQPFIDGVLTAGERSLVYFGGQFSHAFRKGAALPIDRRAEVGYPAVLPGPSERALADGAISRLSEVPLYARVDLVGSGTGRPMLMELELIEPLLGFATASEAAPRFIADLSARLTDR